ncbi:hypothetical protein FACS189454_04510 [Planctomycetales bacterium]|nr:hypothetical protein FACS189454_04510 [Planctomycetales bacterium]
MRKKSFTLRAALATILAAAVGGNAVTAQTIGPGSVTYTDSTTATIQNWDSGGATNFAAFGIDPATITPDGSGNLTITGGTGATLTYIGADNQYGTVFAFRNIGSVAGLTQINVDNLTFTGGKRESSLGGGALFQTFGAGNNITISNSIFDTNTISGNSANGAGGGGLNLNNENAVAGLTAEIKNVQFNNNTAQHAIGGSNSVWGGGLSITSFSDILIDGGSVTNNRAAATNGTDESVGGGIAIYNSLGTVSNVNISNITISGNEATSAGGAANGGGLWLESGTAGFNTTLTNVNFTNNKAIGAVSTTTSGGAIWTDSALTVTANSNVGTGIVEFSGNKVQIGAVETSNSITSQSDVTFNAVNASDKITDNDGFAVVGTVTKTGAGTFFIEGELSLADSLVINGGTVNFGKDSVAAGKNAMVITDDVTIENGGTAVINWNGIDIDPAVGLGNGKFGGFVNTADFVNFNDVNVNVDGGTVRFNLEGTLTNDTTYFYIDKNIIDVGAGGATVNVDGNFQVRGKTVTGAASGDVIKTGVGTALFGTTGLESTADGFDIDGTVYVNQGTFALGDRNGTHAINAATSSKAKQIVIGNAGTFDLGINAQLTTTEFDSVAVGAGTFRIGTGASLVNGSGYASVTVDGGKIQAYGTGGSTHIDWVEAFANGATIDVADTRTLNVDEIFAGRNPSGVVVPTGIVKTGNGKLEIAYVDTHDWNTSGSGPAGSFTIAEGEVELTSEDAVEYVKTVTVNAGATLTSDLPTVPSVQNQTFNTLHLAGTYNANGSDMSVRDGTINGVINGVRDLAHIGTEDLNVNSAINGVRKLTKAGTGDLKFNSTTQQSTAGSIDIQAGGLSTDFITSGAKNGQLNLQADKNIAGGDGIIHIGNSVNWLVRNVDQHENDYIVLGNGDNSGLGTSANTANIVKALELGNVFYDVTADEYGVKFARSAAPATFADSVVSAAYLHRLNTMYRGVNPHIDSYLIPRNSGIVLDGIVNGQAPGLFANAGRSAWVNYVGRSNQFGSSYDGYNGSKFKTTNNGVQTGIDWITGRGFVLGTMFGYENTESRIASDKTKGDDYYFGLYGAKSFRTGFDLRGVVGYGHQNYDFTRYGIDSNTALERWFQSSANGSTLEANLELGRRFLLGPVFSYRPFAGVDFIRNNINGSDEGLGGAIYGKTELDQLAIRLGSDANWAFGRLNLNGSIAFSQQVLDDYAETTLGWNNNIGTLRAAKLGNSFFTFTAGADYTLNASGSWVVFGNYVADVYCDGRSSALHTFSLGTQWKF